MIQNFKHKGLREFYQTRSKLGIQAKHADRLADVLFALNYAKSRQDMNRPGFGLHPLKGRLRGHWAVKVSGSWRVTFRMEDGEAHDVDYLDYH